MVHLATCLKTSKTTLNLRKVMRGSIKCNKKWGSPCSFFYYEAPKMPFLAFLENKHFWQKYPENITLGSSYTINFNTIRYLSDIQVNLKENFGRERLLQKIRHVLLVRASIWVPNNHFFRLPISSITPDRILQKLKNQHIKASCHI